MAVSGSARGALVVLGASALWLVWRTTAVRGGRPESVPEQAPTFSPPDAPAAFEPPTIGTVSDRQPLIAENLEERPGTAAPDSRETVVDLVCTLVRPDWEEVVPAQALLEATGESGGFRLEAVQGRSVVHLDDLPLDRYTLRIRAPGYVHRDQVLDLTDLDRASFGYRHTSQPAFVARAVLWPSGWVAVLVQTTEGRALSELAAELGLEPEHLFPGSFAVRASTERPGSGAPPGEGTEPAIFRPPPGHETWELPGGAIGSLQLLSDPPMWIGLSVLAAPFSWKLLEPGSDVILFSVDAERIRSGLARLSLTLTDDANGTLSDALVTLRAENLVHPRAEHEDVRPDGQGRIELADIVPGRYELTIRRGGLQLRQHLELGPGDARDLGGLPVGVGERIPLCVVDLQGESSRAWIEIGPYARGGRMDELYALGTLLATDDEGSCALPMPSCPSVIRATKVCDSYPYGPHATELRSASVLVDPEDLPEVPLVLVIQQPTEVILDQRDSRTSSVLVVDSLGVVVHILPPVPGQVCTRLIPGTYMARLVDAEGKVFLEKTFAVSEVPLHVVLP